MKTKFHQLLRQYRVLQVGIAIYLVYLTQELVAWMMHGDYADLKDWHLAPITATVPALVTGLFAIVNSMSRRAEKDEHDND